MTKVVGTMAQNNLMNCEQGRILIKFETYSCQAT